MKSILNALPRFIAAWLLIESATVNKLIRRLAIQSSATVLIALGLISSMSAKGQVDFAGVQTTLPVNGLNNPNGVAVDKAGDVFIADFLNNRVVELPAGGGAPDDNRRRTE